ncbi:MAG: glycosyltransferase [Acidobacteriota bacterium]
MDGPVVTQWHAMKDGTRASMTSEPTVSIVIPVFNKIAFTRQCLDRLDRHAAENPSVDVVVVDNASTDGTQAFFEEPPALAFPLTYVRNDVNQGFSRANNIGAKRSRAKYLLFLNNDTLVRGGWLHAMVSVADADPKVGVVGIKQLFPYTNQIHHAGIIITAEGRPQHIYPHSDGSLPYVNKQREYQAVTGSCLLIARDLFEAVGGFDEAYRNGYEDIDLCLTVRQRGRSVVCCTTGAIYHYGQITETRTADDDQNATRLASKWRTLRSDEHEYHRMDRSDLERQPAARPRLIPANPNLIYFADDLSAGSALSWVITELVHALDRQGADVAVRQGAIATSVGADRRRTLARLMRPSTPIGGVQLRWSHYWPQHLGLDLNGRLNLELFVINYLFARPHKQPWDYWLQSVKQNRYLKLPLSNFNRDVLAQLGVPPDDCTVFRPGYSPEIAEVGAPKRWGSGARLLTVTNSHDLERYGTRLLLDAYWSAFSKHDDVTLVVKDYGTSSGDTTLRDLFREHAGDAAIEYVTAFTSKEKLIELYKSCDGFISAHRGEGYGMKILDALACGLPVITPLFGGPTDFCTADNCFPVDFSLVPVGDCLDTRSLRITNDPVWAEPSVSSLRAAMRRVVALPDEARRIGSRARADVTDRFTWDVAARGLLEFVHERSAVTDAAPATLVSPREPTERSPYWMGCRVSVLVPTFNRSQMLVKCLRALEQQTVLPQEFEVIVVDDGSTDDTPTVVAGLAMPFHVKYVRRANAGPGSARNEGLRHATGGLVLFIGDDILAHPRLLEAHLEAHATRSDAGTAILGHIDWPPGMRRSAVMDYVCGPSTLQFAYAFIPDLPSLDFRLFYTSNISLQRKFLLDAAADGVTFDPDFTAAAFEDSEFALRLEPRGLRIVYAADALAHHEHWMDLESFSRREYGAGRMAVVFYRKHPQIDDQLQVKWVADWTDAVDALLGRPDLESRLRALDSHTHAFLRSLADTLGEIAAGQAAGSDELTPPFSQPRRSRLLEAVYAVLFDVERTRGKVAEWYADVDDIRKVDLAKTLLACVRRLEFLAPNPDDFRRLSGTIDWLETDMVGNLELRVSDLEHQLASDAVPGSPFTESRTALLQARVSHIEQQLSTSHGGKLSTEVARLLRRADLSIQYRLGRHARGFLLPQYRAMRVRLRRFLPKPPAF